MIDLARLPKAELHVHIEGTLEPELLFDLAARNRLTLAYRSVEELRRAYRFADLQAFLDLYYAGMSVLRTAQDYYDLMEAYLRRASAQGVRHAEIFFDPQAHTGRGVALDVVMEGLTGALHDEGARLGMSTHLIACFLRDQPVESAMATLDALLPYRERIVAVGLDSAERDHPPAKFEALFARARAHGFRTVAHAGEEGPPAYVWQALDLLKVSRIDHGVRSLEDPMLVERLREDRIPLTLCPLSNLRLNVVGTLRDHPLKRMLDAGLHATVNSDDPAYFGGYIATNFVESAQALGLDATDLRQLARNSFEAAFLEDATRRAYLAEVEAFSSDDESRVSV